MAISAHLSISRIPHTLTTKQLTGVYRETSDHHWTVTGR